MTNRRVWLPLCLTLLSGAAAATEIGTVTLVEGEPRLLRGVTWYKLVAGARVETGDIVTASERTQVQIEFAAGSRASLAAGGGLHLAPSPKTGPLVLALPTGWLKVAAVPPGVRVHTGPFDAVTDDGILVMHAQGAAAEVFVETGKVTLFELTPAGADSAARDAKRGEYWARPVSGAFTTVPRVPKAFFDAMPRQFVDPLPALATKARANASLAVDHAITYAEAEPWLAGRDRAAFEKRFASRLRDPAFRKAVEPNIARYPSWDRLLHPEKYAPVATPAQ